MIVETLFIGRNNTFSLQLLRADEAINLHNGVVEIAIGDLLTASDAGSQTAYLITYDPVNVQGVRWPNFKLKVKA